MAGLGTIFVELDLDATKFEKNQRKLIESANSTSLSIEKNFQNLGIKSDAIYEAMRRSAVNSLEMIKAKSTSTGNEIARAQAATAARLKQIDAEQFGHHGTLLENMKANWIKAAAVITASMLTIRKGWQMVKEGAEYSEQLGILDNLAKKYETTADSMVASMRYASSEMISNADLTSVALEGLAKGLKPDQLIELSDAAKILADTTGVTATTALNELTQALETGRIKGLKGYAGGAVELKDALGELESQLTAAEKTQAMFALVMLHATSLQEQQTKAVDESADSIEKLEAKYKNLTTTISVAFKTLVVEMEGFISKYAKWGATPWQIGYAFIYDKLFTKKATPGGVIVPEPGEQTQEQKADAAKTKYEKQIEALKTTLEKRKELEAAAKKSASGGGGGSTDWTDWNVSKDVYEKAVDAAEYAAKMEIIAGRDALDAKLEALDQQEAALKVYYASATAAAQGNKDKLSELDLEYTKESNKYAEERAQIKKTQELNSLELKKEAAESGLELEKKSIDLAKELYDAKAKYGGTSNLEDLKAEYEVKRKNLEVDKQKLDAELLYAEAKNASHAKEKEILELKKKQQLLTLEINNLDAKESVESKKYTGTYFEGWSSGIALWRKEVGSEFEQAQEMAKTTAGAMKTALSDGFYKLLKGESVSIVDIFATMFDTILKKFTDMCAEMVIKWITSKEAMALAGTAVSTVGTGIGSIVGGLFHEGGIVGESGTSRLMPAYAFAGAPRLHSGLAADEFPAILQKGEAVIPKSKVGQSKSEKSETPNITQNTFNISAVDAKSFADLCSRNPTAIVGPMMAGMRNNKTRNDFRKLMK